MTYDIFRCSPVVTPAVVCEPTIGSFMLGTVETGTTTTCVLTLRIAFCLPLEYLQQCLAQRVAAMSRLYGLSTLPIHQITCLFVVGCASCSQLRLTALTYMLCRIASVCELAVEPATGALRAFGCCLQGENANFWWY
jgi:hypothetical protein